MKRFYPVDPKILMYEKNKYYYFYYYIFEEKKM